jgi:hypothetical protein
MFPTLLWQAAFYKLAIVASAKIYGGCQLASFYDTVTELPVPDALDAVFVFIRG